MAQHKIPAQYATYAQPLPLKPYQPYVQLQPQRKQVEPADGRQREGRSLAPHPRSLPRSPSRLIASKHPRQAGASSANKPSSSSGVGSGGTTSSILPSSTPHAPRQKKSVLDLIAHADSNLLPSTRDLLRKHSYLDSGLLKLGVKRDVTVIGRGREEGGKAARPKSRGVGGEVSERGERRRERRAVGKKVVRRQAWQDEKGEAAELSSELQAVKVQPFRRTVTAAPPDGVPLLDLSKLNEPDHKMKPIELISAADSGDDGKCSELSWGVPVSSSPDTSREGGKDETTERQSGHGGDVAVMGEEEDVEEEIEIEEQISESRQAHMDTTHAKFVEEKILSHERAISSLSPKPHFPPPPPPSPPHMATRFTGAAAQKLGVAMQSHLTFGVGVAEIDLSRRLRFEARVLTHNGRDVHRELCGFFFLCDGSITVYEFRQFGKKSSALPLVQRRVYSHQLGHRRGQPYQINFIRKGSTLHFPPSLLPSLPESMALQPLLALRVTHCSERDKRQLLCASCTPMERVSVDSYLQHPLSLSQEQDWSSLKTLQGMIRRQLTGRGCTALVGLGRQLLRHSPHEAVDRALLRSSLHAFHILLSDLDFSRLWQLLSGLGEFGGGGEGVREGGGGGGEGVREGGGGDGEGVSTDRCIAGLVGEMNEERKAIVRKVFQRLDSHKSGRVSVTSVRRFCRHASNDIEGVWFGHTHQSTLQADLATINYADFENFYEGVSIDTSKDSDFISELRNSWTI